MKNTRNKRFALPRKGGVARLSVTGLRRPTQVSALAWPDLPQRRS
jgi:hypothetical protein